LNKDYLAPKRLDKKFSSDIVPIENGVTLFLGANLLNNHVEKHPEFRNCPITRNALYAVSCITSSVSSFLPT